MRFIQTSIFMLLFVIAAYGQSRIDVRQEDIDEGYTFETGQVYEIWHQMLYGHENFEYIEVRYDQHQLVQNPDAENPIVFQPGAILEFRQGCGLVLGLGQVDFQGTSENPVVFKGTADNYPPNERANSWWRGLEFRNDYPIEDLTGIEICDADLGLFFSGVSDIRIHDISASWCQIGIFVSGGNEVTIDHVSTFDFTDLTPNKISAIETDNGDLYYRNGLDIVVNQCQGLHIHSLDTYYGWCYADVNWGPHWSTGFTFDGSPIYVSQSTDIQVDHIYSVDTPSYPMNPTLITLATNSHVFPIERARISNVHGDFTNAQFAGDLDAGYMDEFGAIAIRSTSSSDVILDAIIVRDCEFQMTNPTVLYPDDEWESGFISFDVQELAHLDISHLNVVNCLFSDFPVFTSSTWSSREVRLSTFHFVQNELRNSTCAFRGTQSSGLEFGNLVANVPSVIASNTFNGVSTLGYAGGVFLEDESIILSQLHLENCYNNADIELQVANNSFQQSETQADYCLYVEEDASGNANGNVQVTNNCFLEDANGIYLQHNSDYDDPDLTMFAYNTWIDGAGFVKLVYSNRLPDNQMETVIVDDDVIAEELSGLLVTPATAFYPDGTHPTAESGMLSTGHPDLINYDGSRSDRGLYGGIYAEQNSVVAPPSKRFLAGELSLSLR